jgi:hypothetical protein
VGGEPALLAARAADPVVVHQAGDLVTADIEAGLADSSGELAAPVHRVVLGPDRLDLGPSSASRILRAHGRRVLADP